MYSVPEADIIVTCGVTRFLLFFSSVPTLLQLVEPVSPSATSSGTLMWVLPCVSCWTREQPGEHHRRLLRRRESASQGRQQTFPWQVQVQPAPRSRVKQALLDGGQSGLHLRGHDVPDELLPRAGEVRGGARARRREGQGQPPPAGPGEVPPNDPFAEFIVKLPPSQ